MRFTRPTRGPMALLQLAALLLSLGVGLEASRCPPGMETGADMPMAPDEGSRVPMDCPLGGPLEEGGGMSCPLAIGGIGPCGTSVAASSAQAVMPTLFPSRKFSEMPLSSGHTDFSRTIQLPPPRA